MAIIIEQGPWTQDAPADPLKASTVYASKKRRVVGSRLKSELAKTAAEGHCARTAGKLVRALARARGGRETFLSENKREGCACRPGGPLLGGGVPDLSGRALWAVLERCQ